MKPTHLPHDWFPEPLPANVCLGERSWLYSSYAFRHYRSRRPEGVTIGRDTGVYHGTFFDLGPDGQVSIGDYCTVVGAIFCTNRRIVIHDYVFIAHEVVLADSFASLPPAGPDGDRDAQPGDARESITLGELSWIGARAILLPGAHIGEGAIVGAAAVVDFEVPPYAIAAGNPAAIVRRLEPGGSRPSRALPRPGGFAPQTGSGA